MFNCYILFKDLLSGIRGQNVIQVQGVQGVQGLQTIQLQGGMDVNIFQKQFLPGKIFFNH